MPMTMTNGFPFCRRDFLGDARENGYFGPLQVAGGCSPQGVNEVKSLNLAKS